MEAADQGEQAPRRIVVELDLAREPLAQYVGAFVMQGAAAHIDGFDLRPCRAPDGRAIARADVEIFFDDAAEPRQRQDEAIDRFVAGIPAIETETDVLDRTT